MAEEDTILKLSEVPGERPTIKVTRLGKTHYYRQYSEEEQDERDISTGLNKDGSPRKNPGRCRCQHCEKVMELPPISWRLYGLCEMCAGRHGKHMTIPDTLITYIRVDDESEEIFYMWKEPGGKIKRGYRPVFGLEIED